MPIVVQTGVATLERDPKPPTQLYHVCLKFTRMEKMTRVNGGVGMATINLTEKSLLLIITF